MSSHAGDAQFSWSVRVYYEDTDSLGMVYHANYLKFMERARTEWLRAMNIDQIKLKEDHNIVFAISKIQVDYLKPAQFNDLLDVTVWAAKRGRASFTLSQGITRADQELVCKATVRIACIDAVQMCPRPIPPNVISELQRAN